MTTIEEKYKEFHNIPFPKGLSGEEILGIDLVMLDADSSGLLQKYIEYKGKLTKSDFELLERLNLELKSVTKELKGIGRTYFSILWNLSNQVVSELNHSNRFLKNKKGEKLHKKWKKDFKIIREILNDWDPLGIEDMVDDEYDAINFLAYSALINKGEIEEIKKTINDYLTKSMEIYETDEKLEEISMRIINAVQQQI
ncbi:MAG: hypothetical protein KAT68_03410 [Bacteroidales bacterium]|nr:hypothetical protein [Bacteroidales bacterium]